VRPTSVLICEDAPGFAVLASAWLNDDPLLEVAGVAHTGVDAVAQARALHPDVILLDRTLPDAPDVAALVAALRDSAPSGAIVLMSSMAPDDLAAEALRLGAEASVSKMTQAHELCAVVRAAASPA